ncbi:hypothetical protein ACR03S_04170 [Limimaricola variabilis]
MAKSLKSIAALGSKLSSPAELLANLGGAFSFVGTLAGAAFSALGLAGGSEAIQNTTIDITGAEFPVRLLLMVIVAVLLGYGLGAACFFLSKRNSDSVAVLLGFLAIGWGLLLVTAAHGLADSSSSGLLPEFATFLFIGLGLCMWLLTFQMRSQAGTGTQDTMEHRSAVVLHFTATCIVGWIVVNLGAIS